MVLVEIFGLQIEASSGLPIVLLREVDDPHRVLPIFIGGPEALAIARGLQGVASERPLTHDLLVELLERTGNHLEEVAVTELRDGTFFAELRLGSQEGRHVLSSRPSDAIALAVRVGAPVYASEEVLDEAGAILRQGDEVEEGELVSGEVEGIDEVIEEFREFLDELTPSDFASGAHGGEAAGGAEAGPSSARTAEPGPPTAEPGPPTAEPGPSTESAPIAERGEAPEPTPTGEAAPGAEAALTAEPAPTGEPAEGPEPGEEAEPGGLTTSHGRDPTQPGARAGSDRDGSDRDELDGDDEHDTDSPGDDRPGA